MKHRRKIDLDALVEALETDPPGDNVRLWLERQYRAQNAKVVTVWRNPPSVYPEDIDPANPRDWNPYL